MTAGNIELSTYRRRQIHDFYRRKDRANLLPMHDRVQGRLRFKLQGLTFFREMDSLLTQAISVKPGIVKAQVRAPADSIVVVFENSVDKEKVIERVEQALREALQALERTDTKPVFHRRKTAYHTLTPERVLKKLSTDFEDGITPFEVRKRLKQFGRNQLQPKLPRSRFHMAFEQVSTLPMGLLVASAGVSLLTGGVADAAVMTGVILLNAGIGYHTQSGIEKTVQGLRKQKWESVPCIRGGRKVYVDVETLVPGDVVHLSRGQLIPADIRLLQVHHLTVNESVLTGESEPVQKINETIDEKNPPVAEMKNMVFRGTAVTGGAGSGVVVATGQETEIGKIQTLIDEAARIPTPMQKSLQDLTRQTVGLALGASALYSVLALLRGQKPRETLQMAASMSIAVMPEGLPTILTASLARGIRKLGRHNMLVRSMGAMESMAAMDHLCLDKTGTITLDEMEVARFCIGKKFKEPRQENADISFLLQICVLNSDVELKDGREVLPESSTETALWRAAESAGVVVENIFAEFPRRKVRHRTEERNLMMTKHQSVAHAEEVETCKGRPAEVLELCHHYRRGGNVHALSPEMKEAIISCNNDMASDSLRVLGVACKGFFGTHKEDWIWLGLVGLKDQIKQGVKELIETLQYSGIRSSVVTGDQTHTALAIAKRIRMNNGSGVRTLSQDQFNDMDEENLRESLTNTDVFSRFSPSQKLALVKALQKQGRVVGMTGDGINDGPALKTADVGVAMGKKGTEVAREVADVILLDDNLDSILRGVKEGRTIQENVRKAVHFILATNASELMPPFVSLALGTPPPMTALQYLWINLATDILPEIALALQPSEDSIMYRSPEEFSADIVSPGEMRDLLKQAGILTLAATGGYLYGLLRYGAGTKTNSVTFLALTGSQLAYIYDLLNSSKQSRFLTNASIGGAVLMAGLPLVMPPLRRVLKLALPGIVDLAAVSGLSYWAKYKMRKQIVHRGV